VQQIFFENILPHPLKDTPLGGGFWKARVTLEQGTHYLIKADSGQGKSTLLNIIYGTRKDYAGNVSFDRTNIRSINADDYCALRTNKIAYLFQDLRLFPEPTALQNIMLKPGNLFSEDEVTNYAQILGVAEQLHKPCGKLSLGQQQRIALIRAVSQQFDWLLLDEPFSHLDARNAKLAMEIVVERCKANKAGVVATSLGDESCFEGYQTMEL
jgi:putative ABC transport system ATP-binding protein